MYCMNSFKWVWCIGVIAMVVNTEVEIGATYTQDGLKMCELVSTDGSRGLKSGMFVMESEDGSRSKWTETQFNHYWNKVN